ncbi:MAG: hypothetical protein EBT12_12485, partial [Marivivens sp.]|nr:hypothetical protein [Marivivens sp.]
MNLQRYSIGTWVSGVGHTGLILWLIVGWGMNNTPMDFEVTQVSVVSGAEYEEVQTAFFDLLHSNGIHPDGALARCGQPIYLPNVPLARRNPDLSPIFYQHRILRGKPLRIDGDSPIQQEMNRRAEQQRIAAQQAERARAE